MRRLLRIGLPSLAAVAAVLALPAVRAAGSSGCQPTSWGDWHLALRQQCVEPRYVCQHMTSAEMMRDSDIDAAQREGLAAGRPEVVRILSHVVGQTRARYGCDPEADAALTEAPGPRALPPGHPPVDGYRAERLPPGHPPLGGEGADRLPPGHPPLGSCPFAGPEAGRAPRPAGPLPFTFEQPQTTTL